MALAEAVSDAGEGTRLSLLVPLLAPGIGADAVGVLPQGLALGFVAALLGAEEPLVVAVPAVQGLVLGGETLVAGSRADLLDHGENGALLLVHIGSRGGEDLDGRRWLVSTKRFLG